MRILTRLALWAVLLVVAPSLLAAQSSLAATAERARRAWQEHRPSELVGRSEEVTVSLPSLAPTGSLGPRQATALFRDLFDKADELVTTVRGVRETGPGEGYVELRRRYRRLGTQEVGQQTVLLAYRNTAEGWLLTEVRVLD